MFKLIQFKRCAHSVRIRPHYIRFASTKTDAEKVLSNIQYKSQRLETLNGVELYPHKFSYNITINSFVKDFGHLESEEVTSDEVRLCGMVTSVREYGKKLKFIDLSGEGTKVQLKIDSRKYMASDPLDTGHLRRGDRIGVVGHPMRTKAGELSVEVKQVVLLAPCLRQIPTVGFQESQKRFKKRYLDFLVNSDSRNVIVKRSMIIKYFRHFFEERGFLEVETPILSSTVGGASAKPFWTHHNEWDAKMCMRVAPELYLKQMVVGGFDKVFEIGKQFRNEGVDRNHNPEFTSCEFYEAWSDYRDLMTTTGELLSGLVKHLGVSPEFEGVELDFSRKFEQVEFLPSLEAASGTKFPDPGELGTEDSLRFLVSQCQQLEVPLDEKQPVTVPRLLDLLASKLVEPHLVQPTLLTHHPVIMSPLAKQHRDKPGLAERFELFVAGQELANAYTEINDPAVQRANLAAQADIADPEAMLPDETFCTALEYGLPPTAGWGCGMDRLTAVMCNMRRIRDTITFPVTRS